MEIDTRNDRSWPMMLLQNLVRPFGVMLVKPGKPTPPGSQQLKVHRSAKKHCTVTERNVGKTWLYDIEAKGVAGAKPKRRILYFAGGGFQSPPSPQHWSFTQLLARKTDAIVTIVSYPLAPNSPAKDSIPHLARLYRALLAESSANGEQVILMGDSAGGNVAICLVLYILAQDPNASVPHGIFLISPCADARNDNPQMKAVEKNDPLLNVGFTGDVAAKWSIGLERSDPWLSPVLGDLEILRRRDIRLDGIVGTWDVLSPDAVLLVEKARKLDVAGSWLIWEKQMHCFPLAWRYGLPDSRAGAEWIIQTVNSY